MIGLVRNEWKKVFLPVLLTTVLLAIAMSVLSCTIYQNYTLHYDLEAWEVGTELFSLLYPLFVVVPLCWNLYYERKNNFLLYVMPRVKIKKYLTAKWIAYALGTLCIIVETKKPEKSRQKAAGCRNTQEVIYTQPLFITPFYLLKGYRSDRLDINIPVIPKAARRDGFTR